MKNGHDRKSMLLRLQAAATDPPRLPLKAGAVAGGEYLPDRHWHREAHFVLSGPARYRIDGEVVVAEPGVVMPIDRWQEHGIERSSGNADSLHVVLHFHDTLWGSVSEMDADGSHQPELLPAMEKSQLFRGVIADGVLPRKTFSMGHSREKRYYLEGRKIK